jgi:hypothetical protein
MGYVPFASGNGTINGVLLPPVEIDELSALLKLFGAKYSESPGNVLTG